MRLLENPIFYEFQESKYKGKIAVTLSSEKLNKTVRVVNIHIVPLADNKKIKRKKILKIIQRDQIQAISLTFPIEVSIYEIIKKQSMRRKNLE